MAVFPLQADGPHPDIPPQQRIFAPFIGSWDLRVTWYADGAPVRRASGEWHFAWVLEGRGVQDVWIVPPRRERPAVAHPYEYGTSIRFFDPAIDAWRSTWIGPMHAFIRTFIARSEGSRVVMRSEDGAHPRLRWSFSDVRPDSFTWRNEQQASDGTWVLTQDFATTRARSPS